MGERVENVGMRSSWVEEILMPRRCVFCGTRRGLTGADMCEACLCDLPWQRAACIPDIPPFVAVVAPLEYSFPVDAALKALKFKRRLDYVPAFAELLGRMLSQLPDDIDALLPVPLHWRRHAMRGFNQAVELCEPLRKQTGLPVVSSIKRVRPTRKQSGLDANERRRNLQHAFVAGGPVERRHVLVIDDVITTGETCRQLAKVALAAGVEKVSVLAVARA
jgi:ComF family protein